MTRLTIIIFSLVVFNSCIRPKEAPQKKIEGINGEAVYVFNEDGSKSMLFKEEYNIYEYGVLIISDTLEAGAEFISLINVASPNHKIFIDSPKEEILMDTIGGFTEYRFRPSSPGTYVYSGRIEYDSITAPFEYKFIVVKKR
jgi:hypothetical protein